MKHSHVVLATPVNSHKPRCLYYPVSLWATSLQQIAIRANLCRVTFCKMSICLTCLPSHRSVLSSSLFTQMDQTAAETSAWKGSNAARCYYITVPYGNNPQRAYELECRDGGEMLLCMQTEKVLFDFSIIRNTFSSIKKWNVSKIKTIGMSLVSMKVGELTRAALMRWTSCLLPFQGLVPSSFTVAFTLFFFYLVEWGSLWL